MRILGPGVMLSAALTLPAAAADSPHAWAALITVQSQQGADCRHEPTAPHVRRFVVIGSPMGDTSLLISGEGEALRLLPVEPGRYALRALTSVDADRGSLHLEAQGDGYAGQWQETPLELERPGCAWTQAHIELRPLPDAEASRSRIALLADALKAAVQQTDASAWPPADAAEFARLGFALVAAGHSDLSIGQLFLSTAQHVRQQRCRDESWLLMRIAVALHRPLGAKWPRTVARVFLTAAQFLRSRRAWVEAEALYAEALALLHGAGMQETETAAELYAAQGTLFARLHRYDQAAAALERAAAIDAVELGTTALNRAITLNNLGHALLRGGHMDQAAHAFAFALVLLSRSEPSHQSLVEAIDSARAAIANIRRTKRPLSRGA